MKSRQSILESTKFVVENSNFVSINQDRVAEFALNFNDNNLKHWLSDAPFDLNNLNEEEKLNFLLVFNSISFCYWGNPKWTLEYRGQKYDGAWGMITALVRAVEKGQPILDANYRAGISKNEVADILRGNTEIPLLEKRWNIMKETGSVLAQKYQGSFSNLVRLAGEDIYQLLDRLTTDMPSFKDVSACHNREIYFYKRAQLLVSDIYQMFGGKGYGAFKNATELTACADYKLPQALRKFRILEYQQSLAGKIDNKIELPHDSEEEIEIRANTIWAVEYIKEKILPKQPNITSAEINDHLWLYTQTKYPDDKPYHLTRTTAY